MGTSGACLRSLFAPADTVGGKRTGGGPAARPDEPKGLELPPLYTDEECFACLSERSRPEASAALPEVGSGLAAFTSSLTMLLRRGQAQVMPSRCIGSSLHLHVIAGWVDLASPEL